MEFMFRNPGQDDSEGVLGVYSKKFHPLGWSGVSSVFESYIRLISNRFHAFISIAWPLTPVDNSDTLLFYPYLFYSGKRRFSVN
jgi:hypothetical protein